MELRLEFNKMRFGNEQVKTIMFVTQRNPLGFIRNKYLQNIWPSSII